MVNDGPVTISLDSQTVNIKRKTKPNAKKAGEMSKRQKKRLEKIKQRKIRKNKATTDTVSNTMNAMTITPSKGSEAIQTATSTAKTIDANALSPETTRPSLPEPGINKPM